MTYYEDLDNYHEEPIDDCDNPFGLLLSNQEPSGDVWLGGQKLEQQTDIVLDSTISYVPSFEGYTHRQVMYILFRHTGEDYYRIPPGQDEELRFTPGKYTLVFSYPPLLNNLPILNKTFAFLLPKKAYAQIRSYGDFAVTFTVTSEEDNSLSNVLFLPGIKGSYLYEKDESDDEVSRWLPPLFGGDNAVKNLAMSEIGVSIKDIYTKSGQVLESAYGLYDVYGKFLNQLNNYIAIGQMQSYKPIAYDWRYDVFDIVNNGMKQKEETVFLKDELENLATTSKTGKVTIVAHSNGGLLAKALLAEYGNELEAKIDKLILVGMPQAGAPAAMAALLHGYEAGMDFLNIYSIVSDKTSRTLTRNFPSAYALLPTSKYFSASGNKSLITNDGSQLAVGMVGNQSVNNQAILDAFLSNTSRPDPEDASLRRLTNLNLDLLQKARTTQSRLDALSIPNSIEVYEIAGYGINTLKELHYTKPGCRDLTYSVCREVRMIPRFTSAGDDTVPVNSAISDFSSGRSYSINLVANDTTHASMLGDILVANYLDKIIHNKADELSVAGNTLINHTKYYTVGIHSPVEVLATDEQGRQTGVVIGEVVEDIPGSSYLEIADSKYLLLPVDTSFNLKLKGTDDGLYALSVHDDNEEQMELVKFLEYTPVSSTTLAFIDYDNSAQIFSEIKTDYDGDGVIDEVLSWSVDSAMSVTDSGKDKQGGGRSLANVKYTETSEDELLFLYQQLVELLVKLRDLLEKDK